MTSVLLIGYIGLEDLEKTEPLYLIKLYAIMMSQWKEFKNWNDFALTFLWFEKMLQISIMTLSVF